MADDNGKNCLIGLQNAKDLDSVNGFKAFIDTGHYEDFLVNDVHPTVHGSAIWLEKFKQYLSEIL